MQPATWPGWKVNPFGGDQTGETGAMADIAGPGVQSSTSG